MRTFRDIPIRQKLMLVTMMTTGVAVLLAAAGIIASDTYFFRRSLQRDLSTLSDIIGDTSTAALAFNDSQAATETLAALRARPHLATACIYRNDGTVLAKYLRPDRVASDCPALGPDRSRYSDEDLTVSHSVMLSGRPIGTLVLVYDLGEIGDRVKLFGGAVFGVLLLASVIAFFVSANLRSAIATPIAHLVRASTRVAETNDYSVRAQKLSGDELGVLVDRFNEMLAGIQTRDQRLRTALRDREVALHDAQQAQERFRFMAESMPQKIFTATPAGEIDYLNRQWLEFTGLTFEQMKGWGWAQMIHPDDVRENIQSWRHAIETGELFHLQHRCRRADGVYRWHLSRAHAMRDEQGKISMWIGSNTDIHEQKEKEEELRRANEDLQQFAYSASHDLQEPIRNVAVYSEIVAKKYHDQLDKDGQQFLGFLMEGGRRLATLINDLLAYTRLGVADLNTAKVESMSVLREVLANLAEPIRLSGAKVTYDGLPDVWMSQAHLQQVLQNLIGNALKYRKEEPPEIHISAALDGTSWRFSVSDNGIGIEPKYREVIFGVFKRLHRDQRYSGTGIGLAICQRVVARYGGRIWVESSPGEGSTFFFTVPQVHPAGITAAQSSAG
jgi:PAS domain S-box-containing protein